MFMTCSTSYCLVTLKDLWNVCIYVCLKKWVTVVFTQFFVSVINKDVAVQWFNRH